MHQFATTISGQEIDTFENGKQIPNVQKDHNLVKLAEMDLDL